jgi:hypothetical protein
MARKRKKLRTLDYDSPEYWNRLLVEDGLSMDRALQPNKISYVGNGADVEYIEGARRTDNGRIMPKPQAD